MSIEDVERERTELLEKQRFIQQKLATSTIQLVYSMNKQVKSQIQMVSNLGTLQKGFGALILTMRQIAFATVRLNKRYLQSFRENKNEIEKLGIAWLKVREASDKAFEPLGEKKTQKGVKSITSMFIEMSKMSLIAWAISQLMQIIGDILYPLQLIEPLVKVVGAIFKVSWAPAMELLAPLISEVAMWLFEWKDVIILFINPIGFLITLIVNLISGTRESSMYFLKLLQGLIGICDIIGAVIGLIWGKSPGLIPAFEFLWNIIKSVVDIIWNTLIKGFEGIIWVFKFVANSIIGIINFIIDCINAIDIFDLFPDIAHLPTLQKGIDYVPYTGAYILHKGEKVESAREAKRKEAMNITINVYGDMDKKMIKEIEREMYLRVW